MPFESTYDRRTYIDTKGTERVAPKVRPPGSGTNVRSRPKVGHPPVTTVPPYEPPSTSTSSSGGGRNTKRGRTDTGGNVPVPVDNTLLKDFTATLLPFLSPEDRQRVINSFGVAGIDITLPPIDYAHLIPGMPASVGESAWPGDVSRKSSPATDTEGGVIPTPPPTNAFDSTAARKSTPSADTPGGISAGSENDIPTLSEQLVALSVIPGELKGTTRDYFLGSGRANAALKALQNAAKATGKTEEQLGPGYRFLTTLASTLGQFSSPEGMNRQQYTELLEQVNPLLEMAGSDKELRQYAELGRMLSLPFFSPGNLFNVSQSQSGRYLYGDRNKLLFG